MVDTKDTAVVSAQHTDEAAMGAVDRKDWFTRLFDELPAAAWFPEPWRTRMIEGLEPIRIERVADDEAVTIKAEMPGMELSDISVEVTDHMLRISAERHQEKKTKAHGGYQSEFRYGSYTRTVPLPAGAVEKKIDASYENGILAVRVPLGGPEAGTHHVRVHTA